MAAGPATPADSASGRGLERYEREVSLEVYLESKKADDTPRPPNRKVEVVDAEIVEASHNAPNGAGEDA